MGSFRFFGAVFFSVSRVPGYRVGADLGHKPFNLHQAEFAWRANLLYSLLWPGRSLPLYRDRGKPLPGSDPYPTPLRRAARPQSL